MSDPVLVQSPCLTPAGRTVGSIPATGANYYSDRRFYVRRAECWGGTFVFVIEDRRRWEKMRRPKPFKTERAAHLLCQRMNDDWRRYAWAMVAKPADAA